MVYILEMIVRGTTTMRALFTLLLLAVALTGCTQASSGAAEQTTAPAAPTDEPQPTMQAAAPAASATAPADPTTPPATPTTSGIFDEPVLEESFAAPTAAPTPVLSSFAPDQPVRVQIGAIDLSQPLVSVGLDENNVPIVPRHDVGWYLHSAYPGEGENVVLWGHVLRFRDAPDIPAPFARLNQVQPGDAITVYAADGSEHTYVVSELVWATPEQVEYILPQGREMLTLVSCIGDQVIVNDAVQMTHRLITRAYPEQ
jgi:LPXTG-site transpeptidase (sortase) family protein